MKILADNSAYSRADLGESLFGQAHITHARNMEHGSDALLRALWRHHPRIMRHAIAAGRNVVLPGARMEK